MAFSGGTQPVQRIGGNLGDTFFTTSTDGFQVDGVDGAALDGAAGIGATATETSCQRARRIGGIDWQTKLIPAQRADGGPTDVPRFFIVRKDTDVCLGQVGRVAAQQGAKLKAPLDPAPLLLQPAALDTLDALGDLFIVDRGGCIGGTVPWLQGRPIETKLPNGDTLHVRPMVTNPLDGSGSFAIALAATALSCRNVYASLLGARKGVFRIKHCASGEERLAQLREGLTIVSESLETRLAQLTTMATARVTSDWLQDSFLPEMFGFEAGTAHRDLPGQTRNRLQRFLGHYQSAPGAEMNTGWGLLQATSYLTTHDWQGTHGDTTGCTDTQLWNGTAGAFEAKAVQQVRVLAGVA